MKPVSLKSALTLAIKAARAAGQVMHDNWHKPKKINLAEAHDIKLELDVRCQALIEKILAAAFPQIPVLGEEGNTGDTSAEYRWVIDPIDGTVNYAYGIPHAGVSIALQRRDECSVMRDKTKKRDADIHASQVTSHESVVGVIYDPFADELWTTTKGEPTRLNGKVVRVSKRSKVEDTIIAMGFSKNKENLEKSLPHLIRISRRAKKIRIMGSAALELAWVAGGRFDAYIERTINLWDVAAGMLLVENAGGEFYSVPAPNGKMRMCADNGRLRKKLQLGGLLK
jgi:myo-inositol-1(or 4)-monophosphatase